MFYQYLKNMSEFLENYNPKNIYNKYVYDMHGTFVNSIKEGGLFKINSVTSNTNAQSIRDIMNSAKIQIGGSFSTETATNSMITQIDAIGKSILTLISDLKMSEGLNPIELKAHCDKASEIITMLLNVIKIFNTLVDDNKLKLLHEQMIIVQQLVNKYTP